MAANDIRPILRNRINKLNALIDAKIRDLEAAPEGNLRFISSHGSTQYRRYYGTEFTYISKSDKELLASLAQKSYNESVLKSAVRERNALIRTLKTLESSPSPESIYENLIPEKQQFVRPILQPDSIFVSKWSSAEYVRKTPDIRQVFLTKKGDYVRSKSELIIADRLYDMNIPYRYEAELDLGGIKLHPDFTLLDIKRRREIYHEHLGLMDDPSYSAAAVERIALYQRNNILLGDRLTISMETKDSPLDLNSIMNLLTAKLR